MDTKRKIEIVESYGFLVQSRGEWFDSAPSNGWRHRAEGLDHMAYVIVDEEDHPEDGWMLWGNDLDELLDETIGPNGPLWEGDHSYHVEARAEDRAKGTGKEHV